MTLNDIYDILDSSDGTYTLARIADLERAMRGADALENDDASYYVREELMTASFFGGAPEKGIAAFAWCIAKSDQDPERFPEFDLLWRYKWTAQHLHSYPQITRAQVESSLDDMDTRFLRNNLSLRPVYALRARASYLMDGDVDAAQAWFQKAEAAPRDGMADCRACEDHLGVELHVRFGQPERAFELAEGLLSGQRSCAEVPHETYAILLSAARALGRDEEASRLRRVGFPMVDDNCDFTRARAYHLDHLIVSGDLEGAGRLVPRQIQWAMDAQDMFARMWSYASLRLYFGSENTTLPAVPKALREVLGETPSADALHRYFDEQAKAIAGRFDARNGNDFVSRQLAQHPHGAY